MPYISLSPKLKRGIGKWPKKLTFPIVTRQRRSVAIQLQRWWVHQNNQVCVRWPLFFSEEESFCIMCFDFQWTITTISKLRLTSNSESKVPPCLFLLQWCWHDPLSCALPSCHCNFIPGVDPPKLTVFVEKKKKVEKTHRFPHIIREKEGGKKIHRIHRVRS